MPTQPVHSQIVISEITLADREKIVNLHRHIRTATDLPILREYAKANVEYGLYEKGWAEYFLNKKDVEAKDIAFIASLGNEAVAFVRFSAIPCPDDEKLKSYGKEGWAELHWLYVLPEYQGQGLGKRLYNLTLQYVSEWGCRQMLVEAYRDNLPTRKFYENLGLRFSHEIMSHNLRDGRQFDIPSVRYVEFNLRK